ncbi:GNAT family N-acetyltransferase [Kineococcus auxinigenes]|uniref:GNAT family N-acetyltransferase n=1 Tax=unclassified Kineococcus TaxID=2621656 RepID=UPI003D7E44DE
MRITHEELTVESAEGIAAEREAAGIWARATAERDQLPSVAPTEEKLAGIQQALAEQGASLHLARRGQRAVGFCLLISRGEFLEIRYLATDPEAWGSGAGRALLEHVSEHARRAALPRGELWVIADNARAINTYERAGWVATDDVEVRGSAGRPERRFVRDFG